MALTLNFISGSAMADAVNKTGTYHWFSPETLRFFQSRVSETLHRIGPDARVFVSSDRPSWGTRRYSINILSVVTDDDGTESYRVQRIGGHGAYTSLNGAHAAARRLCKVVDSAPRYVDDETAQEYATRAGIPTANGW